MRQGFAGGRDGGAVLAGVGGPDGQQQGQQEQAHEVGATASEGQHGAGVVGCRGHNGPGDGAPGLCRAWMGSGEG